MGDLRWTDLTAPESRDRTGRALEELQRTGTIQPFEKEYFRKDGGRVPVLVGVAAFDKERDQLVAFVLDLTEQKRAEAEARESERRYREVQMALAHANRVETIGQLTASIAHEVNQPIAASVTNAHAALRWLSAPLPDLNEVSQALGRIVDNGSRAGEVVGRIRALIKNAPPRKDIVSIKDAILEVIALTHGEAMNTAVSVRTQFAESLSPVEGDRVQLQQVILNLMINAIEAMAETNDAPRELLISTENTEPNEVHVSVQDSGPGLTQASMEHVFDAFYTNKPTGLGLGLSICRSIIEAHGGRLWAAANRPRGAIFNFTLPAHPAHS